MEWQKSVFRKSAVLVNIFLENNLLKYNVFVNLHCKTNKPKYIWLLILK